MAQPLQMQLPDIYISANIPMIIQASVLLALDATAPLPSHQHRIFPRLFIKFAFFLVLVTPIMNTYFLKTIPQSTTQLEVLNRIRGLVLFTTVSLMSVIVISYDKLNILFKFDSITAKIIHGIVAFTTVLFQVINLSLISFTDGLPHFDYVFFPIHCAELFCTLLTVELLFIYGLWRHAKSTQVVRRRGIGYKTARLFAIMAVGIAGNIACHIGLLTANSLEGIATWVPRSVMLSTTNSVLTINALLLLKLWNRRERSNSGSRHTSENTSSHNTNAGSERAVPASPTMPHLSMIGKNKYGGSFIDTLSNPKKHSETCISPISPSGTGIGTCAEQRISIVHANAFANIARPSSTPPVDPRLQPTIPPRCIGSPSASSKTSSMISGSEVQLITRIPSTSLIKLPISPPYPFPHRNEYDHEFEPEALQAQQQQ